MVAADRCRRARHRDGGGKSGCFKTTVTFHANPAHNLTRYPWCIVHVCDYKIRQRQASRAEVDAAARSAAQAEEEAKAAQALQAEREVAKLMEQSRGHSAAMRVAREAETAAQCESDALRKLLFAAEEHANKLQRELAAREEQITAGAVEYDRVTTAMSKQASASRLPLLVYCTVRESFSQVLTRSPEHLLNRVEAD